MSHIVNVFSPTVGEGWIVVDPELTVMGGSNYHPRMNEEVRKWCFEAQISFRISITYVKIEHSGDVWLSSNYVVQLHFPHPKELILFKLRWGGYIPQPVPENLLT